MSDEDSISPRVLGKRKGWEGDELEYRHQSEKLRAGAKVETHVAVDLKQFQNHQVGVGYQAKHVVRQRLGTTKTQVEVLDMTQSAADSKATHRGKVNLKLQEYIKSNGMREFRRQIEEILKSC